MKKILKYMIISAIFSFVFSVSFLIFWEAEGNLQPDVLNSIYFGAIIGILMYIAKHVK